MAGLLDWIGERLDAPLQGVGINTAGMSDAEKWGMRGRVVSAFGNSIGTNPQSFYGQLDNMAGAYADQQEKLKQEQLQQQMQAQLAQAFTGTAPAGAPGAAGAAGAPGPMGSPGGAAASGNPNAIRAEQYRRAAMVLAATNPDAAKKYIDIANSLDPAEEFSVDPKTFMSATGQPVVAVFSKSGGMKVLNVQPLPDRHYQDAGGEILVYDKSTGNLVERIKKTMTAAEAGNLAVAQGNLKINQERFNREGQTEGVDADGNVVVYNRNNPAAGGTAVPGVRPTSAANGEKPTEGQLQASGFLLRMNEASKVLDGPVMGADNQPKLDAQGRPIPLEQQGRAGYLSSGLRTVPLVGDVAANVVSSQSSQLYRQAQEDWVRAKLRKESGAAIGDEEMAREIKTYFPQPGDGEAVIAQKRQARRVAEQAMQMAAGPAAKRAAAPAAPAAPANPAGPAESVVRVRPPLSQIFRGNP